MMDFFKTRTHVSCTVKKQQVSDEACFTEITKLLSSIFVEGYFWVMLSCNRLFDSCWGSIKRYPRVVRHTAFLHSHCFLAFQFFTTAPAMTFKCFFPSITFNDARPTVRLKNNDFFPHLTCFQMMAPKTTKRSIQRDEKVSIINPLNLIYFSESLAKFKQKYWIK